MNWIPCSSSNLNAYAYDPNTSTLYIRFNYGAIYAYYDVPENVFVGLCEAPSKGQFHSRFIKYSYRYERIG